MPTDEFCTGYPHNLYPTPGYWIECAGQTVPDDTIWDESEPEPELEDTSPQSDHPEKADQNIQASQVFISLRESSVLGTLEEYWFFQTLTAKRSMYK